MKPMHPANDLCDGIGDGVGNAVDVCHLWWDPDEVLKTGIARAGQVMG